MSRHYRGSGGAGGIALGKSMRYQAPPVARPAAAEEDPASAIARFTAAQQAVAEQLTALVNQLRQEGRNEEAAILDAQALSAEDIAISDEVKRRVSEERQPLEQALDATISQLRATLEAFDDYTRERAADLSAIGHMLHTALSGGPPDDTLDNLPPDAVIIAADLSPAETARLRGGTIAGFATAYGGPTSHTVILARSLGIPAIVGLGETVLELADNSEVILDGDASLLIAEPDETERRYYQQRMAEQQAARVRRQALRSHPGQMSDGHPVALWANIGHPDETQLALEHGAEGIGLFRTEFLFLNRTAPPDEEEQYSAYRRTVETMDGRPVVIRTLDIGGDKPASYITQPIESNPFLGIRGLRLSMHHPHLFHTQLRALLRAAVHGNLLIMLPMIATPDDLLWGRARLRAAAESLAAEAMVHRPDVPLGVMIETPAAAVTADLLAQEADFMSIGSNDLTQYTMAADRGIAVLSADYPQDAPAVLRLIAQTAAAAHQAGVPAGLCGELAGQPETALLLVGLGIKELSMAPAAIPIVKEYLATRTYAEAQAAAQQATRR